MCCLPVDEFRDAARGQVSSVVDAGRLVAWDDSPLCRLTHPSLTALVRDTFGFGQRAARRLMEVIDGATGDVEDELPRLEPRGSTG
jgi:DNA-binding LacI/PurR family transcriptional regulator